MSYATVTYYRPFSDRVGFLDRVQSGSAAVCFTVEYHKVVCNIFGRFVSTRAHQGGLTSGALGEPGETENLLFRRHIGVNFPRQGGLR